MLYTEDFTMRHYVGFSQIGSQMIIGYYTESFDTTFCPAYCQKAYTNCSSFETSTVLHYSRAGDITVLN